MELNEKTGLTRRTFLAGGAAAATVAGLALAGCGGSSGSKSAASSASASGSAASASASASAAASSGAAKGKGLSGACAYSSTNYSPIGLNGGSALMLAATLHVFEGLYDLDLHDYRTYAALAASDPTKVSDTEYEVQLRSGAKFSDGTDVTAADVVNAFEKNMADSTIGPMLDFLAGVKAKDTTTVTLSLKYPFADLLKERLTLVKVFPAAKEAELSTLPIGSGPWAYVPGAINGDDLGTISFEPNANYNGTVPAKADSMVWSVMKSDATTRVTALQEGAVQVAEAIPDDNVAQLTSAGATVDYVQGFSQAFLMFNTLKAPFTDKRVRQAFFYAIDTKKLIANQLGGHASEVTSFLLEDHKNYHKASTVYTYDQDKAKSLLAEAGASNLEFTLLVNNNWVSDLAPQIKNDLEAVGVKCTIKEEAIQWTEFAPSDSVLNYDVMLTPGDPTCFGNDPDLLMSWWYGNNVWTQGRSCWAKDPNGSFAQLQTLMQTAREATGSAQQDAWNQCFDILADEVPLYALFHRELATGYQSSLIEGFEPIGTTGLIFLQSAPK